MRQRTATRLDDIALQCEQFALLRATVICGEELRFLVSSQLASVTPTSADIVLEPSARNTAPAIAAAACLARAESEDPVMVVMPADHIIGAASVFCDAMRWRWRQRLAPSRR
jgi:mannose-1-phosphate guanylyltransferase